MLVTDEPDTATGPQGNMLPAGLAAAEAELRLRTSLDLAEIARLVLDASVPDFADAAAVFAVERLIRGGEPQRSDDTSEITARRLGTRIAHESTRVTQASFPAGEVIAFAGGSPYARCLRGEPVVFDRPDSQTLKQERPAGRETMSRYASFLALPAVSGDQITGLLTFARTAGPAFSGDDVSAAARLAAGAGAGIANSLTLLRERSLTDTLQHSLLAAEPAVPPGIEVAARCLPAEGQVVGGDWYDILALPGGRSGIIVGDVMGHGPEAAAVMAQLRAAAHALAQLDLEPAELLGHLDRTTATLQRPVLATCVYAVIDPAGQSCTLSAAGHLPPVLAMPDGVTRTPDLPSGQSLGLGSAVYGQARIKLPPGAVIALYTDGLVETRTRSFDQGILALRAALSDRHCRLETACDSLIASLAERYEDDVTVVLARIQRPETPEAGETEKIRSE
ncbi:MAG TPA: GAF domain-containing SpoIIE family protein phosphatase [Trebonia sp.]